MCIAAAQSTGATVLAVDMPGTGEISPTCRWAPRPTR